MPKQEQEKEEKEEKRNRKRQRKEKDITRKTSEKEGTKKDKDKIETSESLSIFRKETKDISKPDQVEPPRIKFLKKYSLLPEFIRELPSLPYSEVKEPIPISESSSFSFKIPSVIPTNSISENDEIGIIQLSKVYQNQLVAPGIDSEQIEQPSLIKIPLSEEKETTEEEEVLDEVSVEEAPATTGEEVETEEIPEFLDLMFTYGGNSIDSGESTLILADESMDEFIEAVRTICCRIFREKTEKGKPKAPIFSQLGEDFEKEITRWMKGENQVFTARLDEKEWENFKEQEWNHIQDRLSELPRENFGFIIFNHPVSQIGGAPSINTLILEPKISSLETKIEVSSLLWGYVDIEKDKLDDESFDHIFEKGRKKFMEKLKDIDEPYLSVVKRNQDTPESDDLHFPLKLFVTKYLAEEMFERGLRLEEVDKIKDRIETERDFGKVVPDIYVKSKADKFSDEVFEIETLFGQGDYPLEKIDKTIEKYEDGERIPSVVNVVLDSLAMFRHLKGLYKKLVVHRTLKQSGKRRFDLNFWTLNVEERELIPLSKIIKDFTQIEKAIEKE